MLIQWLLSLALTAEIILVSMQGFLILSKMHLAQQAIAHESSEIRFLVGYFKNALHEATQITVQPSKNEILALKISKKLENSSAEITRRFFLSESIQAEGIILSIQEEGQRREVLSSHLKSFSIKFCLRNKARLVCKEASQIREDENIGGIEVKLEYLINPLLEPLLNVKNHHRWQFCLSKKNAQIERS